MPWLFVRMIDGSWEQQQKKLLELVACLIVLLPADFVSLDHVCIPTPLEFAWRLFVNSRIGCKNYFPFLIQFL